MPDMISQFIVICLKDKTEQNPATYVQATRRRFSYDDAMKRAQGISPERKPLVVAVPWVETDEYGYPVKTS